MKSSLGTFDTYWVHNLGVDGEKFVTFTFMDKRGNQVDAWSSDPENLRAVAADLIKGAEYLEGKEPGKEAHEIKLLHYDLQAAQELNRALSAQLEGNDGELPR